jgi:hypothetical protein
MTPRFRTSFARAARQNHYQVPARHRIHRSASGWDVIDPSGRTIQHFAAAAPAPAPADGNPNWLSYGELTGEPLDPVAQFVGTWTVPPPPADNTLIVYFFNGLEDATGGTILQPVLQWGQTPHGGIAGSWSIASWYVGSSGSPAFSSEQIAVAPGTVLTGSMELAANLWTCHFVAYPGATLQVDSLPAMQVAALTLEAYTATGGVPANLTLSNPPVSFQVIGLATVSGNALAGSQWAPYGQWLPTIGASSPQSGQVTVAYG